MPFAEHFMLQDKFTIPSTFDASHPFSINVNTGFLPTKIRLINETKFGNLGTGFFFWQEAFWDFTAPTNTNGYRLNAGGTSMLPFQINATPSTLPPPPGISQYDGTKSVFLGVNVAGTTIVRGTGVFTTSTAHGLQVGDNVQITQNVVMKQIGGSIFTVATVPSTTSFTVFNGAPGFFANAGFTADETAYVMNKVIVGPLFYPQRAQIVAATSANPIVLSLSPNHGLTVGQQVRLRVPSNWGYSGANNLQGVITAVSNSTTVSTITIGSIDGSAFTAFTYPAVTVPPALNFAYVIPIGSGPFPVVTPPFWSDDTLLDATANQQFQGFTVGTGLLGLASATVIGVAANDVIAWTAWRADI